MQVHEALMRKVSRERIGTELEGMFNGKQSIFCMKLLIDNPLHGFNQAGRHASIRRLHVPVRLTAACLWYLPYKRMTACHAHQPVQGMSVQQCHSNDI